MSAPIARELSSLHRVIQSLLDYRLDLLRGIARAAGRGELTPHDGFAGGDVAARLIVKPTKDHQRQHGHEQKQQECDGPQDRASQCGDQRWCAAASLEMMSAQVPEVEVLTTWGTPPVAERMMPARMGRRG